MKVKWSVWCRVDRYRKFSAREYKRLGKEMILPAVYILWDTRADHARYVGETTKAQTRINDHAGKGVDYGIYITRAILTRKSDKVRRGIERFLIETLEPIEDKSRYRRRYPELIEVNLPHLPLRPRFPIPLRPRF